MAAAFLKSEAKPVSRSRAAISAANEKLTYVAQHDSLTGLFSRDHFRAQLDAKLEEFEQSETPSVLMLVDLDRFKQVNDIYGHAAGDELLVSVAHRLTKVLRTEDTLARIGGDEFVAIITDLPDELA